MRASQCVSAASAGTWDEYSQDSWNQKRKRTSGFRLLHTRTLTCDATFPASYLRGGKTTRCSYNVPPPHSEQANGALGPVHTERECRFSCYVFVLLASFVNTPIDHSVSILCMHACCEVLRVLCERGLMVLIKPEALFVSHFSAFALSLKATTFCKFSQFVHNDVLLQKPFNLQLVSAKKSCSCKERKETPAFPSLCSLKPLLCLCLVDTIFLCQPGPSTARSFGILQKKKQISFRRKNTYTFSTMANLDVNVFLRFSASYVEPVSRPNRVVTGGWWLFCTVIMATYTGSLVAILTVEKYKIPFNTLEELLNQKQYKFGTLGSSAFALDFLVSIFGCQGTILVTFSIRSAQIKRNRDFMKLIQPQKGCFLSSHVANLVFGNLFPLLECIACLSWWDDQPKSC